MIAHASHDENGHLTGGAAGDQNNEVTIRTWYSRPWSVILRHSNKDVAREIAKLAREGANNQNIGYDQAQRLTFYNNLKNTPDWSPAQITNPCETDCSAYVSAILIAVGNRLKIRKLRDLSPALTTRNMKKALTAAGFTAHVDGVYRGSDKFLLPGDILLSEGHHTAINLDKGEGDKAFEGIAYQAKHGALGVGSTRRRNFENFGFDPVIAQAEVNLICF